MSQDEIELCGVVNLDHFQGQAGCSTTVARHEACVVGSIGRSSFNCNTTHAGVSYPIYHVGVTVCQYRTGTTMHDVCLLQRFVHF